jgi:flagellar hook protein FlgE
MMRSMFSSVSGLRAQQARMDVIGNNIANVNTIGFWGSRVTFQEVFNQTLKGASSPDPLSGRGGTNPTQIGLGVALGSIDMNTTRGSVQRTDSPFDISIEGEGFIIARGSTGETFKFTRAGNLGFDKLGNLTTSTGLNVYGWQDYGGKANVDGTYSFDTDKPVEPINIYSDIYNGNKKLIAPRSTTEAVLAGNLDSENPICLDTDPPQLIIPVSVYDSLGNDYKIGMEFRKTAINAGDPISTEWTWSIPNGSDFTTGATGKIKFDSNGVIVTDDPTNFNSEPSINIIPNASEIGAQPFSVKLDLTRIAMYNAENSVKPANVDGYPAGSFVTCTIGSDGVIMGVYTNGKQQPLGLIGLATFDNPAGLQKVGDNLFIPTANSGDFNRAFKPGSEGAGVLNPGTLELSNVDLANEFTEMIVTQRAFQANSRVITASDEMMMEIANMKR